METKLRSSPLSAEDDFIRLTDEKINLEPLIQKVQGPGHGAVVTFFGCVRDTEEGRTIRSIIYEAYREMAVQEMKKIILEAETRWPVRVALEHRTGQVSVGEVSVGIACAGAHRQEAFGACQYVIHELKSRVPVWKVRFQ